jgi:hypothetical protein
MNPYIPLFIVLSVPLFGNEPNLLSSAPSLVGEGSKLALMHKAKDGYLTCLLYRTNQPVKVFLDAIATKLGDGWEMEANTNEQKALNEFLIKNGTAVEYSALFKNKSNDVRTVFVLYIKSNERDEYSHTVRVDVRTFPPEIEEAFRKTQTTEPNQSPEPTTRTVTDRAPSSTLRASASRGSS